MDIKKAISCQRPEAGDQREEVVRLQSSRRAFTLMELLVVIAVITLLMGLLFPVLIGARERARINRARNEIQNLQQAWLMYWNTYGELPESGPMDTPLVGILAGDNDLEIVFMEFDERHKQEGFLDPWGKPYEVIFDTDAGVPVDWVYQTRVFLGNVERDLY